MIDRQIGQRGQCQHFMAQTADSVSPVDPRFGEPGALVTTAYSRCVQVAGVVFDGILRDPYLASWRVVGTYVLMHAIEDSFSAAHVDRDPHFNVVHLLSWTLIDWPSYWLHGHATFPPATHHAVTDQRDYDYVRWDAHALDGTSCRDFHEPYAVPEECLTERAQAAVGAVVDYLVITYRLRARAVAEGRPATLFSAASDEAPELWLGFLRTHLPSVAVPAELPAERYEALPRADVFVGVQGNGSGSSLGVGLWGGRLFYGPATPFALAVVGGAGWSRSDGVGQLGAGARLGLLLPLVRRFTIGVAPAGLQVSCTTHLGGCQPDLTATLGELLVPLGTSTWLGVEGPRWSWTDARVRGAVGRARAWLVARERAASRPARTGGRRDLEPAAARRGDRLPGGPLDPGRVSRDDGRVASRQRIRGRRARLGPRSRSLGPSRGLRPLAPGRGRRGGDRGDPTGGAISVAGSLRAYVLPDRLALTATPALVRVGAIADRAVGVDVAGSLGILFDLGRIAVGASSPPLSYLSRDRWHALPFTLRLGLRLD